MSEQQEANIAPVEAFNETVEVVDTTFEPVVEAPIETMEETTGAVEAPADEAAAAAGEEEEKPRKSFLDIFRKSKKPEEEGAAEEAASTEATPAEEAPAAEGEVPVEESPAKKRALCGLCTLKKSKEPGTECEAAAEEAPAEEAAVEEAAPFEGIPPAEVEEVAPDTNYAAVVVEEAIPVSSPEGGECKCEESVDVVRCGVMHKGGKFLKSNFNERHCRLLHCGTFQWSKTDDFTKAHEVKVTCETAITSFMGAGETAPHKYRFEMEGMTFACETEEDRDEWVRAFETVKDSLPVAPAEPAVTEEAPPQSE